MAPAASCRPMAGDYAIIGSWAMKKFLTVLVAAVLSGVAVVGTASSADARWGWGYGGWRGAWGHGGWGYRGVGCCGGWGYRGLGWGPGGFAAGAVIGATLATPFGPGLSGLLLLL